MGPDASVLSTNGWIEGGWGSGLEFKPPNGFKLGSGCSSPPPQDQMWKATVTHRCERKLLEVTSLENTRNVIT